MASVNLYALAAVIIKLVLGSGNYFMQKMIAMTCGYSEYYDDTILLEPKNRNHCSNGKTGFEKALFLSTIVFVSMIFAMPLFIFWRRKKVAPASYNRKMVILMIIPALFETVAFILGTYAQILMALSLAMIMKGAKVIFSAIFTVTFLKRKLEIYHWAAVGLCVCGLVVAGGSEYLNNSDNVGTILLGTALLLSCECLKAFHIIFDEKMFKSNKCDVTFVVGMEGIYACILLIPILLIAWLAIPGNDGGSLENLSDTFYRIADSSMITGILCIYPITVLVVTIAGAMITKHLSGVHNALISVSRSIVIWALELIFFYCAPADLADQYGHGWKAFTYLKLIGFVLVIVATLMYDEDIKLPCLFTYLTKEEQATKDAGEAEREGRGPTPEQKAVLLERETTAAEESK
jgi:drug/metabolite transporter (DMT)-like permease